MELFLQSEVANIGGLTSSSRYVSGMILRSIWDSSCWFSRAEISSVSIGLPATGRWNHSLLLVLCLNHTSRAVPAILRSGSDALCREAVPEILNCSQESPKYQQICTLLSLAISFAFADRASVTNAKTPRAG